MKRAAALALAAVLAVACGSSGDDADDADDAVAERADTTEAITAPAEPAPGPSLAWTPCGPAECATLPVPLDHYDPDGASIELAVSRLPATADRIGPLLVNFGGPGSGAVDALTSFPWPDRLRERFDLVAVDPRGVGGSTPLDCGVPADELYAVDHTVEDPRDAEALLDVSEAYAADCATERGDLLPHVGTRDVARDMDAVRAALGDEQLSFLGYSYGTLVGQVYAELFPDRLRAAVLDGVVDPAPDGLATAEQQAAGFEVALARWAAACADRETCPAPDPVAAFERALVAAEAGVPAGDRRLGPGQAAVGTVLPLYAESLWPALDRAVTAVLAGDGGPLLALADRYTSLVEFPAYFAVSCLDLAWSATPPQHLAAAERAAAVSPRFGEALVNDYLRCAVWPVPPDPLGSITAPEAPPLLLVSTTGDPATPHAGAVAVADRLVSATLLTNEGDGHTIALHGDDCVDEVVLAYLVDLELPAPDARC